MKKIFQSYFVWSLLVAWLGVSCARIDELSDNNTVSAFRVLSHTPHEMQLGNSEIYGDTIRIPILDGKNNFPLHFRAEPIFSGPIDRVSGLDFSRELTLDSQNDQLVFYVMAPSGLTKRYVIRAREIPRDRNNYLFPTFGIDGVEPPQTIVSERGAYTLQGDTLMIFTVDGSYPLTFTPEFTISELSRFAGYGYDDEALTREFDNGATPLTFESRESACNIRIESQSEDSRVWSVVVRHARLISGGDGVSTPELCEPTDINPRGVEVSLPETSAARVEETFTDNLAERIRIVVKEDVSFPLSVRLKFATIDGVQLLGIQNDSQLTFDGWDDVKEFYLLDPQTVTSRLWRVEIEPWRDSGNNVLAFEYSYTAATVTYKYNLLGTKLKGPAITLDEAQTAIYPGTGDIYLYMTAVNNVDVVLLLNPDNWKLTLNNPQVTVSPGATYTLPSMVWSGNNSWVSPIAFTVTAQDGTEKEWRVNIRDMRNHTASADCDVTAFSIARYTPNYALFDAFTPVTLDAAGQTVTLKLSDDDGVYPLSVWPVYEISPFSRVTSQHGGVDPLVFATDASTQAVDVTAEDGTVKTWTVALEPPPREPHADVEHFEVTSVTPGVQVGSVVRDAETGVIRLGLDAEVNFPFDAGYTMTLSRKAKASVPVRGTFTFSSYSDAKTITVTAQNGSTREWKVQLKFEPQLANWNLDTWSNGTTPASWGTANNSFISGTNRIERESGDYAAELSTGKAPIVGTLAAGSLFLGWFDSSNALGGLNDPIKLTFFGQEFAVSGKLIGMEVDVRYTAGSTFIGDSERESASCVIELVKYQPEKGSYVYHGMSTQGVPHSTNTAVCVARGEALLANAPGTSWKETDLTVVPAGRWTTLRIPIDYPNGTTPDFTHLSIVFSSSAQGDRFKGVSGSKLGVDNIRLLYE